MFNTESCHSHEGDYIEEELSSDVTVAKYATLQNEGGRSVERDIEYFNLDVIFNTYLSDYRITL